MEFDRNFMLSGPCLPMTSHCFFVVIPAKVGNPIPFGWLTLGQSFLTYLQPHQEKSAL